MKKALEIAIILALFTSCAVVKTQDESLLNEFTHEKILLVTSRDAHKSKIPCVKKYRYNMIDILTDEKYRFEMLKKYRIGDTVEAKRKKESDKIRLCL